MTEAHENRKTNKRVPYYQVRDMGRRDFMRLGALVAAVTGVGFTFYRYLETDVDKSKKILVTDNCVGCTGCAAVCPTLAIEVIAGGISASDEKCISCGYCQTSCAVDGIRVLKPTESVI